jgi:hypothetical protein
MGLTRDMFDNLIFHYSVKKKYIDSNSDIVKFPNLEKALAKLSTQSLVALNDRERNAMKGFKANIIPALNETFVQDIKRRRFELTGGYVRLSAFNGNNSTVERFFSIKKIFVGLLRHNMNDKLLEMILFLNVNRDFWNESSVNFITSQDINENLSTILTEEELILKYDIGN